MKGLLKKWFKRYGSAEFVAVISNLTFGLLANSFLHNPFITAIAATVGDNAGYYGSIIIKDLKAQKDKHKKLTFLLIFKTLKHILFEFGPAEILDTYIFRPVCMYIFPMFLRDVTLGLLVGKFVADIIFYLPVFVSLKLRRALRLD